MQLEQLCGNTLVKERLLLALQNNALPHAVLIAGVDGCGRSFVANALAADKIYPDDEKNAQLVMKNENTEIISIEGEGASGQISVAKIRDMRANIYKSSFSSNGKAVIIYDAHMLTISAANALLKVLEEPPADVQFILTTHATSAVIDTIKSRCSVYILSPVSLRACEQFLIKALPPASDKNLPLLLSQIYQGRIGAGLQVIQNTERMDVLRDAMRITKAILNQNTYQLLKLLSAYELKEMRLEVSQLFCDLSDLLLVALKNGSINNFELPSPSLAASLLPHVQRTQALLFANVSAKLCLSDFAINSIRK